MERWRRTARTAGPSAIADTAGTRRQFCAIQLVSLKRTSALCEFLEICARAVLYGHFPSVHICKHCKMRANLNIRILSLLLIIFGAPLHSLAKTPDCTGVERWATQMALVHLKNAGLIEPSALDLTKTKIKMLASEKRANDIYRQIHHISFTDKSGNVTEVITSNDASNDECSMSGVDVFVISRHLGG